MLEIAKLGDPILRKISEPVSIDELQNPETQKFIDDMIETMELEKFENTQRPSGDEKNNIERSLQEIRLKLLDLTKRNKLLNFRRSKQSIFVIDEQPNQVFQRLSVQGKEMIFRPLPELDAQLKFEDEAVAQPKEELTTKEKRDQTRVREETLIQRSAEKKHINK